MPCILIDPTKAACPTFEGEGWDFLRQSVIAHHQGQPPLTEAEAIQKLKDAWAKENEERIAAWDAQLEADKAELEEAERIAQEEEERQLAQQEKEAEEQRRKLEEKKPKINPFDPTRRVSKWIEHRPAPYALNKINQLEYIELDYFTQKGCKEAYAESDKSISHNTLGITSVDQFAALRPLSALKPSKNIRKDEDLTWEEMLEAKNSMLHFMAKSGVWPQEHAESLAAFFVRLELHPKKRQTHGQKTILLYQSHVRREWFDALKRDEGFNIELIEDDLMRALADEVGDAMREKEIDQIRRTAAAAYEVASSSRSPSKRTRDFNHDYTSRGRSTSPSPAESPKKRTRSRSPQHYGKSAGRSPEKRGREVSQRSKNRKTTSGFFQAGAGSRGGVCAVCLGRHEHNFSKCNASKLWDGGKAEAWKNEQGRLVTTDGLTLCFDWQLPRGCAGANHPERHCCSGCGKSDHGAQTCPRAETA